MNLMMLPIHRPVAVSMFFVAILLLGWIAWFRLPVELFPSLEGDRITVQFDRPGSEPGVVEREILLPLEAAVSGIADVNETFGEVRGARGQLSIQLESGSDIKVRQLEVQRIVADLQRSQPPGTRLDVRSGGTGEIASLAMMIHVLGPDADADALYDVVEQLVAPRFVSVPGVSQALVSGGAGRQVTVTVDPDRAVALGLTTDAVTRAIGQSVGYLRHLGNLEDGSGRTSVLIDERPRSVRALGDVQVQTGNRALVRHVADVDFGYGIETNLFRVNGKPTVGLVVFQEQSTNLVRLGGALRQRVDEVRDELAAQGIDLVIGFDAADAVQVQIDRLAKLGASGFVVALLVLYFFIRQWRAVLVVGLSVPISLMAALSLLYLAGQSLNLITLFGLALAIGLVVDNSVVVFEAVQRHVEHGLVIEAAVETGLRRTMRAIIASSVTTAVVFLPLVFVDLENRLLAELSLVVTLSILLPLAASLVVAVGLVPLLAHRLAAPAARVRLAALHERRMARGGVIAPDPAKIIFNGVVASALRQPQTWITGIIIAIMVTIVVAVPWVGVNSSSREPDDGDTVQLLARFPGAAGSIDEASRAMARLEAVVIPMPGVEMVEAQINEDGGTITAHLLDPDERPPGFKARDVRNLIRGEAKKIKGLDILRPGEESRGSGGGKGGGEAAGLGSTAAEIVLSGPDSSQLQALAQTIEGQLKSMSIIESAWTSTRPGLKEFWIEPIQQAFESLGMSFSQVLPALRLAGREGQRLQPGFVTDSGREYPLVVEREGARLESRGRRDLTQLRVQTPVGAVPVTMIATLREMPPAQVIAHHNGRREIAVNYRLRGDIPDTGPTRIAVEEQIADAVRSIPRPSGTTIENQSEDDSINMLQQILVPAVLLLFLVLAMTFESLSLPLLVLLSLPLTVLGATWALALAGMPLGQMAALGALTLVGLTVNPGILVIDRMQQLVREGHWSSGAAALAAVRERTRPVLMTMATTVAGLWPLAISTGRENEIWPPFATVVIGGLITSSLLTLLVLPVGYVLLRKIDDIFDRVGPWLVLAWLGATGAIMAGFIVGEVLTSVLWQVCVGLLVGNGLLAVIVILWRPKDVPEPDCSAGPPRLEVRHLYKIYGSAGPVRRALLAPKAYVRRVLAMGGRAFHVDDARDRLVPLGLGAAAVVYIAIQVQSVFWSLIFALAAAALVAGLLAELRRARGLADATGAVFPGGPENHLAMMAPWLAIALCTWFLVLAPMLASDVAVRPGVALPGLAVPLIIGLILLIIQAMRRSARLQTAGELPKRLTTGSWRAVRNLWRLASLRLAGLDLPVTANLALNGVSFTIDKGMVGILGPNGAGKTTLLRQLAGVLNPTRGTILYGGVPMGAIQRHLARWVGYLPQDAGMPGSMTARDYLTWYAALYDLAPDIRAARVTELLEEVGLSEKSDERIEALSGGMRQRVSVARTLLRLPPVIIVDEPTAGLDPRERIRFRNLLSRLARDRIVLMSTHVVEDVAVSCDRVLVFDRGQLLFDGETATLADVAKGRVWEVRAEAGASLALPDGALSIEEKPVAEGGVAIRVLALDQPTPEAVPLDASLEDGYLWMLRQAEAGT